MPIHDEHKLSDGWRYWKVTQGSGDNGCRKLSSIDPLEVPTKTNNPNQLQSQEEEEEEEELLTSNNNPSSISELVPTEPKPSSSSQSVVVTWSNFWNPLTYIPTEDTSGGIINQPSTIDYDQVSTRSQSTTTPSGWFGWIWPGSKFQHKRLNDENEEENAMDLMTSMELKKSTKEYKKYVATSDACWAWYQNSNQFNGEVSVLGTKSETSPVELSKYPIELTSIIDTQLGVIVPEISSNYRQITTRTKIRLGAQLYYNFKNAEKHIYIKKITNKPEIRYILVISIIYNNNCKQPRNFSAKQISDNCIESIKEIFDNKLDQEGNKIQYQIESISLEIGKIKDSVAEDLFKLLINWRVNFKKIELLFMNGYKQTFPLACQLLLILLSRGLMDNVKKTGLFGIESIVPGSDQGVNNGTTSITNEFLEMENFPWFKNFDLIISDLISKYNVKLTFLGSLFNISSTLGLQLSHPNIFRCLFIPTIQMDDDSFNNDFETQLLKLLLISHNLGHQSSRLLIQLTKYFQPIVSSLSESLQPDLFKNALINTIHTTTLLSGQSLRIHTIEDEIINNEYNLIWTLHAFLNDFKNLANINSLQEIRFLIQLYHTWKPWGKSLTHLKYMLEVLKIEDYSGAIFFLKTQKKS